MSDEIVLGQPAAEGGVDVPILADLSRRHAIIRREREAYVLTPVHKTAVDGRIITEPTVLRDNECGCAIGDPKCSSRSSGRSRRPQVQSGGGKPIRARRWR